MSPFSFIFLLTSSTVSIAQLFQPPLPLSSLCIGVACPIGTECDGDTGVCRPFRSPTNIPSSPIIGSYGQSYCINVACPVGTECDPNTNECRPFRYPDITLAIDNRCRNIPSCLGGYGCDNNCLPRRCDNNYGYMRRDRCPFGTKCDRLIGQCVPVTDNFCNSDINCPIGMRCDTNTNLCRQFRQPITITPPIDGNNNPCAFVTCPIGKSCDMNTGVCQQFRRPFIVSGKKVSFNSAKKKVDEQKLIETNRSSNKTVPIAVV